MSDLPKYVTVATISGRTFFKVQRANGRSEQGLGAPYWRYQKHFKTLEQAVEYLKSVEPDQ